MSQLLGPYNTQLQTFMYQQLLALYQQAVAAGAYAGTTVFDETVINNLIKQSANFSTLPSPSEGQIVTDDSLNYPLSLLEARFNALISEASSFDEKVTALISVLEKDTKLLDILLSGADLQSWIARQIQLEQSQRFSWDYGMGNGSSSNVIDTVDPLNGVIYPTICPVNTYLDVTDGSIYSGLVAPSITKSIPAQDMIWTWSPMTPGEQSQTLYGNSSAELYLLESSPIVNYLPNPIVNVELPNNGNIQPYFAVNGTTTVGSVPIYVQTFFVGRKNNIVLTPQNICPNPGFEESNADWTFGHGWSNNSSIGYSRTGTNSAIKQPLVAWSSTTSYIAGNAVSYLGYEYVCVNANTNNPPDLPLNIYWQSNGLLQSSTFPLSPLNQIYVECWMKSFGADGIVTASLVCLDTNGNKLSPSIALLSESSAEDWIKVWNVLQTLDNPAVTSGIIQVSVHGQTQGIWSIDDVRIHSPQSLSPYQVNQDNISVYTTEPGDSLAKTVYFANSDFVVDSASNITFMDLVDGVDYNIRFTELYPAYQCSINETVWSPIIMLDPDRPYPDHTTEFYPLQLKIDPINGFTQFPITDDEGIPTGMYLEMIGRPKFPFYFEVTTPTTSQYGATAVIEIDLSVPTYINGLVISPFSPYPMRLSQVSIQSFEADTNKVIGVSNTLLDRPMILTFPTTLLSKIYLTCYQESYDLSEYVIPPQDYIRRDALFSIQAILPYNVQREQRAISTYYRGAEYIFGVEDVAGINSTPILPGIFIAGAHHFIGCPDIFRFDVDYIDPSSMSSDFNIYLCWVAYNSSDIVVNEETNGIQIYPATSQVFPFQPTLDRSIVDHVDIFLKFVLRNSEIVLQRYLLQVQNV